MLLFGSDWAEQSMVGMLGCGTSGALAIVQPGSDQKLAEEGAACLSAKVMPTCLVLTAVEEGRRTHLQVPHSAGCMRQ